MMHTYKYRIMDVYMRVHVLHVVNLTLLVQGMAGPGSHHKGEETFFGKFIGVREGFRPLSCVFPQEGKE